MLEREERKEEKGEEGDVMDVDVDMDVMIGDNLVFIN